MKKIAVFVDPNFNAIYSYTQTDLKPGLIIKKRFGDVSVSNVSGIIQDINLRNSKATVIWDSGKTTQEDCINLIAAVEYQGTPYKVSNLGVSEKTASSLRSKLAVKDELSKKKLDKTSGANDYPSEEALEEFKYFLKACPEADPHSWGRNGNGDLFIAFDLNGYSWEISHNLRDDDAYTVLKAVEGENDYETFRLPMDEIINRVKGNENTELINDSEFHSDIDRTSSKTAKKDEALEIFKPLLMGVKVKPESWGKDGSGDIFVEFDRDDFTWIAKYNTRTKKFEVLRTELGNNDYVVLLSNGTIDQVVNTVRENKTASKIAILDKKLAEDANFYKGLAEEDDIDEDENMEYTSWENQYFIQFDDDFLKDELIPLKNNEEALQDYIGNLTANAQTDGYKVTEDSIFKYIMNLFEEWDEEEQDLRDMDEYRQAMDEEFPSRLNRPKASEKVAEDVYNDGLEEETEILSENYNDTADFIMAYESGELSEEEIIAGFQKLLDNNLIDGLQGTYQRMARDLIEAGLIDKTSAIKPKDTESSLERNISKDLASRKVSLAYKGILEDILDELDTKDISNSIEYYIIDRRSAIKFKVIKSADVYEVADKLKSIITQCDIYPSDMSLVNKNGHAYDITCVVKPEILEQYLGKEKTSAKGKNIEDETPLMPWIVADAIIDEVVQFAKDKVEIPEDIYILSDITSDYANSIYKANPSIRKKIKGKNGREELYKWMRHWLASELKKAYPDIFNLLPNSFIYGASLKANKKDFDSTAKKENVSENKKDELWDSVWEKEGSKKVAVIDTTENELSESMNDKLKAIDKLGDTLASRIEAEAKGNYSNRDEEIAAWDNVTSKYNLTEDEDNTIWSVADGNIHNWVMRWLTGQGSLNFTLTSPEVMEAKLDEIYKTLKIVENKMSSVKASKRVADIEDDTLIAHWVSRSGKDWVKLFKYQGKTIKNDLDKAPFVEKEIVSYHYTSRVSSGNLGNVCSDQAAIDIMQEKIDKGLFQPDSAKTPMKRVADIDDERSYSNKPKSIEEKYLEDLEEDQADDLKLRNPEQLWIRLGDNAEYENFDGIDEIASYISGFMDMDEVDTIRSYNHGIASEPNFSDRNYISLFWGDNDAQISRDLTSEELADLIDYLKMEVKNKF